MKHKLRLVFALIFTAAVSLQFAHAAPQGVIEDIVKGLKTGDAGLMAKHFNANIDLSIPGYENIYSSKQSEMILKTFFKQYIPKDFVIKHQGSARDGSQYSIGLLSTSKGIYRTYFLLKKNADRLLMFQLRIEQDKP
ncbi:MAG: DUF4783 domain-containing protein [Bacteroidota bacterium]|jgi:hypothetical protein